MATRARQAVAQWILIERLRGRRTSTIGAIGAVILLLPKLNLSGSVVVFCSTWLMVRIVHFFVYEQSEKLAPVVAYLIAALVWHTVLSN